LNPARSAQSGLEGIVGHEPDALLDPRAARVFTALGDALRVDVHATAPRAVPHHRRDDDAAIAAAQVVDHVAGGDLRQLEHGVDYFNRRRLIPDRLGGDNSAQDQVKTGYA